MIHIFQSAAAALMDGRDAMDRDSLEVVVVGWRQFLAGAEQRLQPLVLVLNAADGQRRRSGLWFFF